MGDCEKKILQNTLGENISKLKAGDDLEFLPPGKIGGV